MKNISLEDFQKINLVAGTVLSAENITKSKKLLRLEVDIGSEKRQLIAGLAEQYKPKELIGQQIVIIANLEPKMIYGLESQGMLLAAGDKTIALLQPDKQVKPGTKIY